MTNEKKLNINQLTTEVNEELKKTVSNATDARLSSEISERRVRDYMSKGLLDKPFGQGREKWFGQLHIDKLLALRQLQSDGLSDQQLKKLSSSSNISNASISSMISPSYDSNESAVSFSAPIDDDDAPLRSSAMNFLSELSKESKISASSLMASASSAMSPVNASRSSVGDNILQNYYSNTSSDANSQAMGVVKKQINKVWNEYQLDDEGKIFLKMESNTKIENPSLVLEQIKSILNIGEKK